METAVEEECDLKFSGLCEGNRAFVQSALESKYLVAGHRSPQPNGTVGEGATHGVANVVVDFPSLKLKKKQRSASFVPLQEWEGHVMEIGGATFTARLVDVTQSKQFAEEEAEFLLDDLSSQDRELLSIGAIFRWTIGYRIAASGAKQRASQVVFRRMPIWTKKEFQSAEEEASEIVTAIRWE